MPQNIFSDSRDLYNLKTKTTTDNLSKPSSGDNPPFIWPGVVSHDLGKTDPKTFEPLSYKPLRGYIRRLNEFYKKMGLDTSSINNRKCNFQFQPDTVTRTVSGNSYDTQYFFNQDPGQLTVPIPGQSTFNIKLLFNREAEVTSNKYLSSDRRLIAGFKNPSPKIVDNKDALYVNGIFNQSWVTKIGVLADILVLDAVVGQGINSETLNIINKIAADAKAAADATNTSSTDKPLTDKQLDAQDRKEFNEKAAAFWGTTAASNPNMGNQAFLVPTPVRIVLSNNMMVEGFVLQTAVNFHKFSRDFIPTQATVELSVQALYIGFAKQTTMLTMDTLESETNGPDKPTAFTELTETQKSITDGLKSIYKQGSISSSFKNKDLLDLLLTTEPTKELGFSWNTTPDGYDFILNTLVPLTGGTPEWFWEGNIRIQWDSYVDGAPTPRGLLRTSAGGGQVVKGYPPSSTLQQWGTLDSPLIIATGSGALKVTEFQDAASKRQVYRHAIVKDANPWSLNLPDGLTVPRPYEEDKFIVKIEITIKVDIRGTFFDVGQAVYFLNTVAAGTDVLFNKNFNFQLKVQD